jgi:hypothetical protein
VADLGTWPRWSDVVVRAVPDEYGAWRVRLGLKVGPLALGWDVRMARVVDDPLHLRFERVERDGRHDHSAVVIDVAVTPFPTFVRLDLSLLVEKRVPFVDLQRELDRRAARTVAALQALASGP